MIKAMIAPKKIPSLALVFNTVSSFRYLIVRSLLEDGENLVKGKRFLKK
jgi:hypothetical protein